MAAQSLDTLAKMYQPRYVNAVRLGIKLKRMGAPDWVVQEVRTEIPLDLAPVVCCCRCVYARPFERPDKITAPITQKKNVPPEVWICHRTPLKEKHGGGFFCAAGQDRSDVRSVEYKELEAIK